MDKIDELKEKLANGIAGSSYVKNHSPYIYDGRKQAFILGFNAAIDLQLPVLEWCKKANDLLNDIDAALPHDDDWIKAIRELTEQFKTINNE